MDTEKTAFARFKSSWGNVILVGLFAPRNSVYIYEQLCNSPLIHTTWSLLNRNSRQPAWQGDM